MDNELSSVKRMALSILDYLRSMVINDCTDEEIASTMVKFHPSVDEKYFNPDDYLNYDEACKILHLGSNRGKLNALCKANGIKNRTVKNRPLGFKKSEILKLKQKLK